MGLVGVRFGTIVFNQSISLDCAFSLCSLLPLLIPDGMDFSATVGKSVMELRVVDAEGDPCTLSFSR